MGQTLKEAVMGILHLHQELANLNIKSKGGCDLQSIRGLKERSVYLPAEVRQAALTNVNTKTG
jgi:hypothetical protein